VRRDLEQQLDALNAQVIEADDKLKDVKACLSKAGQIVSLGEANTVSIEAVPGKARDLLSRAQVSISGRSGARLPLGRHGAGTQSVSVLFLFESFLKTMLAGIYGPGAVPMLAVEEPETHLHPSAVRALWSSLSDMPGQKIVATHSGDLLAKVPLGSIRRFCHDGVGVAVRRLGDSTLSPDDVRKLALHVRATRGELLFARCWLLVEGATEVWLFEGIADVLGVDLERCGVRLVQYAQVMPDPFIRLADDLGIQWFCLADGDEGGRRKVKAVPGLLGTRPPSDHLLLLDEAPVEHHLCRAGFGHVYEANISDQKRASVPSPGSADYWPQVVKAQGKRKSKEELVLEVVDAIRVGGEQSVPPVLRQVLEQTVRLARRP
jgi:putative ATP-dependent endonuclease of the OLD family